MFKLTNKVALVTGGSRPPYIANPDLVQRFAENALLPKWIGKPSMLRGPAAIPITRPINLPKTDQGAEYAKDNTRT